MTAGKLSTRTMELTTRPVLLVGMKIRQQASVLQTPKILIVKILVIRRDNIKHERESILFC